MSNKGAENLNDNSGSEGLKRTLGLFDASMIMIGIVIGSGIFVTTGIIAGKLPSISLLLLAWLFGGIITLLGSFIFAELGSSMPEAGGQYVYLKKAYGSLTGFLYGWITFLVYMCGAIAGLSVVFTEYLGSLVPSLEIQTVVFSLGSFTILKGQLIAVFLIILLSAINYMGVMFGKIIQNLFTIIKIGAIVLFVGFGFFVSSDNVIDFSINPMSLDIGQLISGFGIAMVAVFWTFDGWNNLNFVAGEIKNPEKNLTRSLVLGTVVISILYLLVNFVYVKALSISEMSGVVTIAETASNSLFGKTATIFLTAAILISVFGALNGTIFVGARVYYAMAKDKLFFKKVGEIHPKYKTPGFAIIIQAVWASILALTGSFEQILTYVIFVSMIFWIAAAASVYTIRKKFPDLKRPYKTWGYPYTPAIFILVSLGILINTLIESPMESIAGIGLLIIGIPVYYYWSKKK